MKNYFFLLIFIGSMNFCCGDVYEDSLRILSLFRDEMVTKNIESVFLERWPGDALGDYNDLGYFRLLEHYLPLLITPQGKFPKNFHALEILAPAYLDYAEHSGKPVSQQNRLAAAFLLQDSTTFRSIYEKTSTDSIAKKHLGAWAFIKYQDTMFEPDWNALLKNEPTLALRGLLLLSNVIVLNGRGNTILRKEFQQTPELIDLFSSEEKLNLLAILVNDHLIRFPEKLKIEDFRIDPLSGNIFSHLEKQLNGVRVRLWTEYGKLSGQSMFSISQSSNAPLRIEIKKKEDWLEIKNMK